MNANIERRPTGGGPSAVGPILVLKTRLNFSVCKTLTNVAAQAELASVIV